MEKDLAAAFDDDDDVEDEVDDLEKAGGGDLSSRRSCTVREGQKAGQEGHPNSFHQQQLNVTRTAVLLSRTQLETLISFLRALAEPAAADKDNKG